MDRIEVISQDWNKLICESEALLVHFLLEMFETIQVKPTTPETCREEIYVITQH